jgi:hypothetical protein
MNARRPIMAMSLLAALLGCERPASKTPLPTQPRPAPPVVVDFPAEPTAPATPAFRPSRHGFAFVNAFKGSPIPPALRHLRVFDSGAIPARFGLCGGMCLLAADHFHADAAMPTDTTPPTDGTPLYASIYNRQLDSFDGINLPLRVLQLMAAPDAGPSGLQALTARELPAIRARLAEGELVPLCLILVGLGGKPWDNHQVLAYADDTPDADPDTPCLRIYDPNFPKDDAAALVFARSIDGLTGTLRGRREGRDRTHEQPVRGIFATPYTPRKPPDLSSPDPEAKKR